MMERSTARQVGFVNCDTKTRQPESPPCSVVGRDREDESRGEKAGCSCEDGE